MSVHNPLPPGIGPRRAAQLLADAQENLERCVEEIRVLREVLKDAAGFVRDDGIYDSKKLERYRVVKARVAAALRARATLLRDDAPDLYS